MGDSYKSKEPWREIQNFLPEMVHFTSTLWPNERFWPWRGHSVHLDDWEVAEPSATVILLHGVGTNGRLMSLILGRSLAQAGLRTIAPDLPNYGLTEVASGGATYGDWVDMVFDLVRELDETAARPILLFGLSAGGLLAYHVAAKGAPVRAVVGLSFLDQRIATVREQTSSHPIVARLGTPLAAALASTPLGLLRIPMRAISKMRALVNDGEALKVLLGDRTSAGNWVSIRFLHSYLAFAPEVEPEEFVGCPILFAQPELDRWTPAALSEHFLSRIQRVPVLRLTLDGAGHYPLEAPALRQLAEVIGAQARYSSEYSTQPRK